MAEISPLLTTLYQVFLVLTFLVILLDNREPSETIAWLFVLVIFPIGGFILYLLFGRNWRRFSHNERKLHQFLQEGLPEFLQDLNRIPELQKIEAISRSPQKTKLFRLLQKTSSSFLTVDNTIEVYHKGEDKFARLFDDLKSAKSSIHMEYFIWRSDKLGRELAEVLIAKVKEGVEVRILYDFFGGFWVSGRYLRRLRRAGIKIYAFFNFLSPLKAHTLNYRNHRKIVVVDGRIAYTGGMNVGQEYLTGGRQFSSWRDTHMRLEGQAVPILQAVFLSDWHITCGEKLLQEKYFPKIKFQEKLLPMQITTSGPDSEWQNIQQLFFSLISSAEKTVNISSPYFIPDAAIYTALKTAALSGVDVKVIMAGNPDGKLAFWSAFTFFEDLLKAGVRFFHYDEGFMHAKMIVIDSEICSLGSANMDVRSFHLNYEVNMIFYDETLSRQVDAQFWQDLSKCREYTLEQYQKLSHFVRLRNSTAKLMTPLL